MLILALFGGNFWRFSVKGGGHSPFPLSGRNPLRSILQVSIFHKTILIQIIVSPQNEHTYKKSKRYFTQVDKCIWLKNQVEVWGKYPRIDIWLPICQSYHISRQLRAVALDADPRTPSNRGNLNYVLAHWQQTNQPDEEGARDTGLSKHSEWLQRLFRVTLCLHRCHHLGFTMSRIIMSITKDNLFTKIAVVIFIVIVKCVFLLVSLLINVIRFCKVTSVLSYSVESRVYWQGHFLSWPGQLKTCWNPYVTTPEKTN